MRVLFCSQAAHTGGGVEAWLEAVSSALARRGHDVVTGLAKGKFHDPERYRARHEVVNPLVIDSGAGYRESRVTSLLHAIRRTQPDVVVPVHLAEAFLASAFEKTRGRELRLVACIHGQGADRLEQVAAVEPFVDFAVGVSQRTVTMLRNFMPDACVAHIPTGVPEPLTPPRVRTSIERVAYVGRLDDSDKRVLDLIALASFSPDLDIHVVGSGPDEQRLRAALPRATFHGTLTRHELYRRIYPMVDGLLVFSPAEAGPIVAWEAMVNGVVPIVSDYCGRSEENVLRDGETAIVFAVGDIEAAARRTRSADVAALSRDCVRLLPAGYREQAFEDAWEATLLNCTSTPSRCSAADRLPPLVSSGRLSALPVGVETMAMLRRLIGTRYIHREPGSEWPH